MLKYSINYLNGGTSSFVGGKALEGNLAFHIEVKGCTVLVPYAWYKNGTVKELVA